MSKLRITTTEQLVVGQITNKGRVESIYDNINLLIDGLYYDIHNHKITIDFEFPKESPSFSGCGMGTF